MTRKRRSSTDPSRFCNQDGHRWADGQCTFCGADRTSEEERGGPAVKKASEESAHKTRSPPREAQTSSPHRGDSSSDEAVRVTADTAPVTSPLIMSREEVAMAFRDLRAGCPYFAKGWGERLFATLGAFRAKAERLEREAAGEVSAYEKLGAEIGRLVEQKQEAYGRSFDRCGEVLRVLYPEGIPPEKMDDAAAVVRILDKLFRIATDRDALSESPYHDIAGYALLGALRAKDSR